VAAFERYIGIDYSGAQTPTASLKGLRVYMAEGGAPPGEVFPPPSPRMYWTRRGVAEWLVERLAEDVPSLVGIDHGFSFPMRYFEVHGLEPDWAAFLDDFQGHWPTDDANTYVDFVRDGSVGNGTSRMGNSRWRRLTEEATGRAKSVFHFDVQGSVAKSTHAGIPWLRFIRQRLGSRVISGLSTAGMFPLGAQPSLRSIRRCGAVPSRTRAAPVISMMPSVSQRGWPTPTGAVVWLASSVPI
jgi:hypothetical protein